MHYRNGQRQMKNMGRRKNIIRENQESCYAVRNNMYMMSGAGRPGEGVDYILFNATDFQRGGTLHMGNHHGSSCLGLHL